MTRQVMEENMNTANKCFKRSQLLTGNYNLHQHDNSFHQPFWQELKGFKSTFCARKVYRKQVISYDTSGRVNYFLLVAGSWLTASVKMSNYIYHLT